DRGVIVEAQMPELLDEIVAEQPWSGDAARISAGLGQPGERPGDDGPRELARIADPELGVGERAGSARLGIGRRAVADVSGDRAAQILDRFVVDIRELVD